MSDVAIIAIAVGPTVVGLILGALIRYARGERVLP